MEDNIYEEMIPNDETYFPATADEHEQRITAAILRLNTHNPGWTEDAVYQDIDLSQYGQPPFQKEDDLSGLTETQIKRRHVIKSLIDTEKSYIDCLDTLVKDCQPMVTSLFSSRPDVMKAFIYLRMMFIHHVNSQEKLKDRSYQNVSNYFREFAEQEIVNLYSLYINCYSVAIEILKEAEKTKQAFRDFLKAQCTLSIEALMLRPVQRLPQFILILKDLLKTTPDDDVEKIQLQDCLALLEHVCLQLNERRRRSEQTQQAQRIYTKLKFRPNAEKGSHWLIRQDDVRQLSSETIGKQPTKERRLLLMNECLVSACLSSRESEDYTFKWSVGLQHLDLKEQSMIQGMEAKSKHEENVDNLAELNTLKDDYSAIEQMIDLAKSLNRSYPDLLDTLQTNLRGVQQNIQKTLNTTGVELIDLSRNRTYAFLFDSSKTKQAWCTDFLISKNASDSSNNPAWSVQEGASAESALSTACFIRHLSADVPRQFTKVKCATQVIMPLSDNPSMGLPHLWVCSATERLGKVSIISFHSGRPNLLESFKACNCEIICAETIPCSAQVQHELAFSTDTVWMGTIDSEIVVFAVLCRQNVTRAPLHVFHTTAVVVTLRYIKDRMFAGYGVWAESSSVLIGYSPVSSFLPWHSDIWIGCDKSISVFEVETLNQKTSIHLQTEKECEGTINCMVHIGHGLWVSYNGKSIMRLYHVASRKLLQEYDVSVDLNTFCTDSLKCDIQSSLKHEITSLMSSPSLLWVGTSTGIILNYPLLLNQDSAPKIIMRPNISMHGFCGSSKFFSIVPFGSVASGSGSNNILDLHLKPMEHEEADYKHADIDATASNVSLADKALYDSHVYMTLLPKSSSLSSFQEDGTISSLDTIQMQGNSEPRTGQYEARISLIGDIFKKNPISNNSFILQDQSSNAVVNSPIVATCHKNQGLPSNLDRRAFVNDAIHEQRTEIFTQRTDSGYGSAECRDGRELLPSSGSNSLKTIRSVTSGGLKRQFAIRKSSIQSIRDSVSSAIPISQSGSWKMESTNSYVVISGGDGYRDWKNRNPLQYRNDEALLLAWMIKI